jgi:hypothetical protein
MSLKESHEKKRIYDIKYRTLKKDHLRKLKKIWRQKNRDKINFWKLRWATSENGKKSARRYYGKSSKRMRVLYIQSAKKRGLAFDISQELFNELIKKDCFYCGQSAIFQRNGLDRIDNTGGYIKENVVPCCFVCNQMKGKLSEDNFISHLIRILEYALKEI